MQGCAMPCQGRVGPFTPLFTHPLGEDREISDDAREMDVMLRTISAREYREMMM